MKSISLVLTFFAVALSVATTTHAGKPNRPNIVCIITDQQHAGMMSCTGNRYLQTPAMDRIARDGTRFELAYCSNPVCLPSRVTMMTGFYPSRAGIKHNGDGGRGVRPSLVTGSMGWIFRNAGYETAYGGKVHLPKGMTPTSMGFEQITGDQRAGLAEAGAAFVAKKHERPFLLVLSFINPHDICYMALQDLDEQNRGKLPPLAEALRLPTGVSREEFFAKHCPPLPENFEPQPEEPEIIETGLFQRRFKKRARDEWSPEQWRLHRWAYCRLTEMVDAKIGKVLDSVREAGLEETTLIVFTSDHGDMDSAHRLEHKTVLYEEATRVPLIFSYPGATKPGGVDTEHLVSAGIDLIPTMCDFAGIDPPEGLPGRSLRSLAQGQPVDVWREQLFVEGQFGRMLRTARFKYSIHESGQHREQLIDLDTDPGEMTNLAGDPQYRETLDEHRQRMSRQVKEIGDEIGAKYMVDVP
ncbi:MAG: sulfatase-like hydrolase/transferase [Planctomycetes bacterium]|nr:sulfatase-like hydrolase/transferase [Planctomycetota bacterium]